MLCYYCIYFCLIYNRNKYKAKNTLYAILFFLGQIKLYLCFLLPNRLMSGPPDWANFFSYTPPTDRKIFCKVNKACPGTCSTTSSTCVQGQFNKMAAHMLLVGSLFVLKFRKCDHIEENSVLRTVEDRTTLNLIIHVGHFYYQRIITCPIC